MAAAQNIRTVSQGLPVSMEDEKSNIANMLRNDDDSDEGDELKNDVDVQEHLTKMADRTTDDKRNYQAALLELAKERNLIICLPTGSGKTYIALQLAKHYLPAAIEESKHIVFLATTVPLVHQQAKYFKNKVYNTLLDGDIGVRPFTGDMNVDAWGRSKWLSELDNHQILVMTPQIFLDILDHAYISFTRVLLLILDECHHAGKGNPMCKIMESYRIQMSSQNETSALPRILGLTATIIRGAGDISNIQNEIMDIENIMCSRAVTYHDYEEVLKYSTNATLEYIEYSDKESDQSSELSEFVLRPLREAIQILKMQEDEEDRSPEKSSSHSYGKKKSAIKEFCRSLTEVIYVYNELGPYCSRLAACLKRAFVSTYSEKENEFLRFQKEYVNTSLIQFIKRIEGIICQKDLSFQITFVTSKLKVLANIIQESGRRNGEKSDKDKFCAIVFAQKRIMAQILSWYFKDVSRFGGDSYKFIRPAFVVGTSSRRSDTKETRVAAEKQAEVVQSFHQQKCNLVFSTSVLEEGLDVPMCNLVVRFDDILTYPSYVQSRGRARRRDARFIVLTSDILGEKQRASCSDFGRYNCALSDCLRDYALHLDEKDSTCNASLEPDILPAFCPGGTSTSPKVTMSAAISLIHQYCDMLPGGRFVPLRPASWWTEVPQLDGSILYQAYVKFPHSSVVRAVVKGPPMANRTLAKRAAFLEACKELYNHDGLDSHLWPNLTPLPIEVIEFLREADESDPKNQTKYSWYEKKVPDFIVQRTVKPDECFDTFVIHLVLKDPSKVSSDSLYNFEKKSQRYGLILPKKLGMVSQFGSFEFNGKFGCMEVIFEKIVLDDFNGVGLSTEQINTFNCFHKILFETILELKIGCAYISDSSPLYVVPLHKEELTGDFKISWDVISKGFKIDEALVLKPPSDEELKMANEETNYTDSVIIPWYRKELLLYSVMAEFNDRTVMSNFEENSNFTSYEHYYQERYNITAQSKNQHLLKCSVVSKQLNFLSAIVEHSKLSKGERKSYKETEVTMVPEFTRLYPYPSSLYVQAKFIPSILHRIYRLLLAEQLRIDVANTFSWTAATEIVPQRSLKEDRLMKASPSKGCTEIILQKLHNELNDVEIDGTTNIISNLEKLKLAEHADVAKTCENNEQNMEYYLPYIHPFEITVNDIERIVMFKNSQDNSENEEDSYRAEKSSGLLYLRNINEEQNTVKNLDESTDFNLNGGPNSHVVMQALTVSNANDSFSLERLETMGDSFLKYCVSVQIYCDFPNSDEGVLTQIRSKLISNKHLYKLGKAKNIPEYLSGGIFNPVWTWLPPGYNVPVGISKSAADLDLNLNSLGDIPRLELEAMTNEQLASLLKSRGASANSQLSNTAYEFTRLSNKSIADSVEALIGAYFTDGGRDCALRFMDWLGIRSPTATGNSIKFGTWSLPVPFRDIQLMSRTSIKHYLPFIEQLEKIICYKFNDPWLLVEAFTHSSYTSNTITGCYQRLEFLGDAVLDFLVTTHIYHMGEQPPLTPGELTDLRSALVNNITFGSLSVRYGLHKYLLFMSSELQDSINVFVGYQESQKHQVTGHFTLLNDTETPIAENMEVPKVLGDIFESLAGAIFLDCNMKLDTTWRIFYRLLQNEIDIFTKNVPMSPIREVYEKYPGHVQIKSLTNALKEKSEGYNGYLVRLKIKNKTYFGSGSNKVNAKNAAAKLALSSLKNTRWNNIQ